ncbi:MAG: tetratricopeptide repeat protein [Candidatus Omnitrophica bacterium]|nr:tetratricopeptide repeat protein [Candidatus Omnitrophota bacterium]
MRLFLRIFLILLFSLVNLGWIWQDSVVKKNREGKKLYSEGKPSEALSKWRDAQIESPDKEELHYNIGNALHQEKKYEDAYGEYEKSLDSKDAELQSKTYYNMGNTHYRMGKLTEAIEDYKKALDINPDDEDAKYNIEFIRKKIKENLEKEQSQQQDMQQNQGQEQQSQQQKMQEGQEDKDKEEKASETKEAQEEEDREEQLGKKEEGEEGEEESVGQKKDPPEGEGGDMSEEDAIRLLDALKDDEKELQKELRTQPGEGRYRVDRDW